jgi:lipoprotein-releasing system ATP-binding protein
LDSQRAEELFQLLQQARNEADLAIVVVTHSEAWAQNADRTLHLSDGAWRD